MGTDMRARYKDLAAGNVFKTLRILVIGRPGAGKSTLIRKILGLAPGKGPDGASRSGGGAASRQDVNKEWSHPTLPLKIHECDVALSAADEDKAPENALGLVKRFLKRRATEGASGAADAPAPAPVEPKFDTVKKFLKLAAHGGGADSDGGLGDLRKFLTNRQQRSDFAEHVHLVLYVASAQDERLRDNAPVLEEVGNHETVPILLIVTRAEGQDEAFARNIEAHVGELLERVPDKRKVLEQLISVDFSDTEALAKVSARIQAHLTSEELKSAWAAAQAVDFHEKIRLSAREIVGYKEAAILCSPAGLIPGPHQTIVGGLLVGLCRALCRIWGVPPSFKRSLRSNIASEEVFSRQLNLLVEKIATMGAAGASPFAAAAAKAAVPVATRVLTTSVMTSISQSLSMSITPVALAAAAVGWLYASRNDAYHSMLAMVSLGVMVVGSILYVKAKYDPREWNLRRGKDEYDRFIQEFLHLHGEDWKNSVGNRHAVSDVFNPEKDREVVMEQLIEYFDQIVMTSRHERLGNSEQQEPFRLQGKPETLRLEG
ncbi:hypothetical protein MPTK1_6g07580 [Marchantia polymorpha subsp. ruderalis]|uniref:G domain-containing protein n=1 Tax=Marchantia polymorpha subsp. ruderalis TaxID=1480154 RepID=A0AAF6BPK1_MARPO|nr:hypothetical protein Mp_6g07580 [Marchantia polymorpha subsp. ruderalis]